MADLLEEDKKHNSMSAVLKSAEKFEKKHKKAFKAVEKALDKKKDKKDETATEELKMEEAKPAAD